MLLTTQISYSKFYSIYNAVALRDASVSLIKTLLFRCKRFIRVFPYSLDSVIYYNTTTEEKEWVRIG